MASSRAVKPKKQPKVVKAKRPSRHTTRSTKNHRFQPFTERIAKLKIDPIRRRRRPASQEEPSGERSTFLGTHLEEWRDSNLSETFSTFVRVAAPLCDGLPAVLYNEDRIMDLLVAYIEKKDALALEPLLSLLAHFAHDLDTRFEKHFQRAVVTITTVAASHPDPAVVEWSFTCLAWLFKFLSRLLVPDLRPLYDIMAPYLGKEGQKTFIIRFAAESMSYLIRKAAALYERDSLPLSNIIVHVLQDCQNTADLEAGDLHRQGVMTLLTESIKGVQGGLHSHGLSVLQSVLCHASEAKERHGALVAIVKGIVTSIIHHVGPSTFGPIQETVVQFIEGLPDPLQPQQIDLACQLLFTIATVRKGVRVTDWTPIVDASQHLLQRDSNSTEKNAMSRSSMIAAIASVFQNAPVGTVGQARGAFKILTNNRWKPHFLEFCDLFARLGHERFQDFLLPTFEEFVVENFLGNEDAVFRLLPVLLGRHQQKRLAHATPVEQEILNRIQRVADNTQDDDIEERLASANLALNAEPYLVIKDEMHRAIWTVKLSLVKQSLAKSRNDATMIDEFALGKCFHSLLNNSGGNAMFAEIWPMLCTESHRFLHLIPFWTGVLSYLHRHSSSLLDFEGTHMHVLHSSIIECLSMSSHDIRQSVLDVMQMTYAVRKLSVPDVLETASTIESMPISLDTSRNISLNIRRLANGYSVAELDSSMQQAVPSYCFGLLNLRLAQAWDDACLALAHIAATPVGEDVITNLAQKWIETVPRESMAAESRETQTLLDMTAQNFQVVSDFECSNLEKVSAICQQIFEAPRSGYLSAQDQFKSDHAQATDITPNSRAQALKVLSKIPSVAEKHSRMLVPILLRWAGDGDSGPQDEDIGLPAARWVRKDQKAMLGLFAQFTNPKVLFQSQAVYSALLNLVANGDVEIQRSALGAILAWKDPAVKKYEEHLVNLLDEARFREELSVFLQNAEEGDDTAVHAEHHSKLMPVLLRLLYGRAVAGGSHGQVSRRKALFVALSRYDRTVLEMFLDVALGPLSGVKSLKADEIDEDAVIRLSMPPRQQLGMINMMDAMLETLGPDLEPLSAEILDPVLLCSVAASRLLDSNRSNSVPQDSSLLRSIRQSGIQCLSRLFGMTQNSETYRYARATLRELIRPRLSKFASENTQSISGSLRLIATWASSPATQPCLLECGEELLAAVSHLLRDQKSKDDVRLYILQDILDQIFEDEATIDLEPMHVNSFVQSIEAVINQEPSKVVLDACVSSLTLISGRIYDEDVAESISKVSAKLLTRSSKFVSPGTKTKLLKTILPLIDQIKEVADGVLYDAVCGLFSRLQDLSSRSILSEVLSRLSSTDSQLSQSAEICQDLNSYNAMSEEADHEKRDRGFMMIFARYLEFSTEQWRPILHNCLFYVRDGDDLVTRTSASRALERFIDAAAYRKEDFMPLTSGALLSGLVYGMKSPSELVRAEYLRLLGCLVDKHSDWSVVKDMRNLTLEGDDEASFFTNVLHIQQHRRLRALRRLSEEGASITSNNVTQIFIPLLEHFVFDPAEGDAGRALANQSILTLGALARALNWTAFKTTFKRYASQLKSDEKDEKIVLRLLSTFVDALGSIMSRLEGAQTSEIRAKRFDTITGDFVPPLAGYLHHKDESTVDRRMPVAVTVVKLLLLLPEHETASRMPPVLTDVCQILRSRSQEARDQARKALTDMLALVGPNYLGFALKELRGALQRGYQLHVLSFTVHSLLVNNIESYQSGNLNECLPELVDIVMDDIFGITGQEKDAEEYKSGMKEVKSSKSFDTMELLARITPVLKLGRLLQPLRALLTERLDSKMIKKIEDLLSRLRKGIDQNPAADNRDMLVFCHEVVRQVHSDQATRGTISRNIDKKLNRYLVQAEPGKQGKFQNTTTSQTFKLVAFALNLLRKVLRRHEDLMTPANLTGFLPLTGDALVEGNEEVQVAALKLLSTIMKVPMTELEINAAVYVKVAVNTIKNAPSMATESSRASLEMITATLREKRTAEIAERDLATVLKALKNDLDEPDRQSIVYKLLRAILSRKVMITEVYEIMDAVGRVMVTNADRTVREGARSVYLQFMLDYPQGKDRLRKQSGFLVENLKYKHAAGRQTVMEMLNQLVPELANDAFDQLAFTLFIALVPVQVADSDQSCRQYAGALIRKLFERADGDQITTYIEPLDKWLRNGFSPIIQIAALKGWMELVQAGKASKECLNGFRDKLDNLLESSSSSVSADNNRIAEYALSAFEVLADGPPDAASVAWSRRSTRIWDRLVALLKPSHSNANGIAARLIEKYFAHLASCSSKNGTGLSNLPLRGSDGLKMDGHTLREICYSSLRTLRTIQDESDDGLQAQTIKNLVFIGRCFAASEIRWQEVTEDVSDVEGDDDEGDRVAVKDPSALAYLFNRLSYIVRQENFNVLSRMGSIQCQASLIQTLHTVPDLPSVLRPLFSLTDPSVPRPTDRAHQNLAEKAHEVLDMVQKQVGSEKYISALGVVRTEAKARREGRRQKRRIEAVSAPERWAAEKKRKHEGRKAKLSARATEAKGKRRGW